MRGARTVSLAAALMAVLALPVTALANAGLSADGAGQRAPLEKVAGTVVEKLVMLAILRVECNGSLPIGGLPGSGLGNEGFVVVHQPADRSADANVIVQGASPNSTYQVELVQTPAGPCTPATLTTDVQGDGSVHLSAPIGPAADGAFVFTYTSPCPAPCVFDLAITPEVVFS